MPPIALEETLERIRANGNRSTTRNVIVQLVLEALVEQLRIRRLRMEDRVRSRNSQTPRKHHRSRQRNRRDRQREEDEDGIVTPAGWQPDPNPRYMINGYVPGDGPPSRHPVPGPRPRTPPQDRFVEPGEIRPAPQERGEPSSGDHHRRRRHQRPRSPSLGPPPKWKPKLGPLLGFGDHYMECVNYYVADRDKETRKGHRHERREARKQAKAENPHNHREHRHRRRERSPGPIPAAADGHHLAEAVAANAQAPRGENPHYEPTPYSAAVEDIERWQADVQRSNPASAHQPSNYQSSNHSDYEPVYNHPANQPPSAAGAGAAASYYNPNPSSHHSRSRSHPPANTHRHHRTPRSRTPTTPPRQHAVHVIPPSPLPPEDDNEMRVRTMTAPPPYRSMAATDERRVSQPEDEEY
ncbi:hypothetical protein BDV96DRAFT_599183 [Lophiotrema nucula]|uniref:Uncharacterized protein n=1 Tax=Lophiotrema nucula TaxID=690887 RepID=A0A6A5Z7V4_9PLEO|nr:hypothetical protein BDV96DRAFT_599183 [Lophiotrema nucula]